MEDELSKHSGPWTGWSIQDGRRIYEKIRLAISHGVIRGEGSDADGRFDLDGLYEESDVILTRCYSWTTEPSQQGVGIRYTYRGKWDGQMITGRWFPERNPWYGGPFEMWPDQEEVRMELALNEEELTLTGSR